MKKLLLNLIFPTLLLLVAACAEQTISTPTISPTEIAKEEQAVYATFFSTTSETIVILQDTSIQWLPSSPEDVEQRMAYIAAGLPNASKDTLAHYLERNRQSSRLPPDMQIGSDYILLGAAEFSAVMDQPNGWDAFYEKYSRSGYMQLSRVGFNQTMDQAIVYVASVPGPMMGAGNYYLMERQAGQWVIKEQVLAWVS